MRLLPFGRVLPVHCAGDPPTRIGWAPAPRVTTPGLIRFAIGHTRTDLLTGEITTGTSDLVIIVHYVLVPAVF